MSRKKQLIDLTGQRFGMLTVLAHTTPRSNGSMRWLCQCDCGSYRNYDSYALRAGDLHSCGCQHPRFRDNTERNREIRQQWSRGRCRITDLAQQFELSTSQISRIVNRRECR